MNMIDYDTYQGTDLSYKGSYWGPLFRGVRIKDWSHFLDLAHQSDKELGIKTYIFKGTLAEANRFLLGYNNDEWRYNIFDMMVSECFKSKNIVYTDDPEQTDDSLLKLNSLYYMIMSFRKGEKMKDPLCFNYFENDSGKTVGNPPYGKIGIHPGHTRMLLGDIYKGPVYVLIFDYTNGLFSQRYRHLKLWHLYSNDQSLSMDVAGRNFFFGHTAQMGNTPGTIHTASGEKHGIRFREVKGDDADIKALGFPSLYMPPRKFEKTENSVIVNGVEVLSKRTSSKTMQWRGNKYNYYWELQK